MKEIFDGLFFMEWNDFVERVNNNNISVLKNVGLMSEFDRFKKIIVCSHRVDRHYIFAELHSPNCLIGFRVSDFEMFNLPDCVRNYNEMERELSREESTLYVEKWRSKLSECFKYKEFDLISPLVELQRTKDKEVQENLDKIKEIINKRIKL